MRTALTPTDAERESARVLAYKLYGRYRRGDWSRGQLDDALGRLPRCTQVLVRGVLNQHRRAVQKGVYSLPVSPEQVAQEITEWRQARRESAEQGAGLRNRVQ